VASRLANMTVGGDRPSKKDNNFDSAFLPNGISQSEAAKMLNVSERMVRTVRAIEREANDLILMDLKKRRSLFPKK